MFFPQAQAGLGSFLNIFSMGWVMKIHLLCLEPLSWPRELLPFHFPKVSWFHRLVQIFVVIIHRFPLLSFDSLANAASTGVD